jgi:hypothetical protein
MQDVNSHNADFYFWFATIKNSYNLNVKFVPIVKKKKGGWGGRQAPYRKNSIEIIIKFEYIIILLYTHYHTVSHI